ncbi:MAG: hypothetical protein SFU56_14030 [Capsulimonadales bacterium]|nr:hypothetical protein [Capsulimonadales bacterium]
MLIFAVAVVALLLAGCGGSGSGRTVSKSAPNAATRTQVQSLHQNATRRAELAGFQTESTALVRNGPATRPGVPKGNGAPLVGAFLRHVACVPPARQAASLASFAALSRLVIADTGREDGASPGPSPGPDGFEDFFYYDFFLGLWVEITNEPGKQTYSLFVDEGKTRTAGRIVTTHPTDYSIYPQTYESSYSFTEGTLAGTGGRSLNVLNADGSGRSDYEHRFSDGSKESGVSSWTGNGDSTGKSRWDSADGNWSESVSSWRADGSGGTRFTGSDGYTAEYLYHADGSGRARITGPDPGLPVTIVWDIYGNTTVTYADGSVDYFPGWGQSGGGDTPPPGAVEPAEPVTSERR